MRFTSYAVPSRFFRASTSLLPWLWATAAMAGAAGLSLGLLHTASDAPPGDAGRILIIQVPAAWMSMVVYAAMAAWAAIGWLGHVRLASMAARALAPTGFVCTVLALVTGAFWTRSTWGTWWMWDARLTSELILLLLYGGYLGLAEAIEDPRRADRAGALVAIVGAVSVPVICFSVRWWDALHQGATVTSRQPPELTDGMLPATGLVALAFLAWAFAIVFVRLRAIVLERERDTAWVRALEGAVSAKARVRGMRGAPA